MKKRQYLNQTNPSQNLDSFLDILTNTVGVLIFISLFVYLVAAQATKTIRTPILTESEKKARFFEVRNQKVNYIETKEVNLKIQQLIASLSSCYKPEIPERISPELYSYYLNQIEAYQTCQSQQIAAIENFQATTKYYDVRLLNDALVYEPKETVSGENSKELTQDTSQFRQILQTIDPKTEFLAFIVKADSYEAFRAARQVAWDLGFDVGWEPQTTDEPIAFVLFSSGGRSIRIQ